MTEQHLSVQVPPVNGSAIGPIGTRPLLSAYPFPLTGATGTASERSVGLRAEVMRLGKVTVIFVSVRARISFPSK